MGCFSGCAGDNWWWIILLVLLVVCNDDCNGCLDCIRDLICNNVVWIIALLLLCNGGNNTSDTSCSDRRGCNTCGCGCN